MAGVRIGRWWRSAVLGLAALAAGGCAVLLLSTGVLGGIAVSDDTVQTEINRHPSVIYGIARDELLEAGMLTLEDAAHWTLKATTRDKSDVTMTITRKDEEPSRMRIQARRNFLPNVELAHQLSTKILKRL